MAGCSDCPWEISQMWKERKGGMKGKEVGKKKRKKKKKKKKKKKREIIYLH
jgi:hypothetical protein